MKRRPSPLLLVFFGLSLGSVILLSRAPAGRAPRRVLPQASREPGMVAVRGSYAKNGYGADLVMWFPAGGGKVSGTIEGACSGTLDGLYSRDRALSANAAGVCGFLLMKFDARAAVRGSVDPDLRTGSVDFTATALGRTLKGTVPLIGAP